MAGAFVGLDYAAALALAPEGVEIEDFKQLLLRAEAGLIAGLAKLTEDKPDGGQE